MSNNKRFLIKGCGKYVKHGWKTSTRVSPSYPKANHALPLFAQNGKSASHTRSRRCRRVFQDQWIPSAVPQDTEEHTRTLQVRGSFSRLIFMYPLYNAHQLKETSLTLNPVLIFYILLENLKMSRKKILPRVSGMTVSIV